MLAACGGIVVASIACGGQTIGEAARPKDLTAHGAMSELTCQSGSDSAEPLVVDWGPDKRGDLEIAMRSSVAVVHYDCKTIRLLHDCRLNGNYTFSAITTKVHLVRLENAEEIRANLPLNGMGLAVNLGGELSRGSDPRRGHGAGGAQVDHARRRDHGRSRRRVRWRHALRSSRHGGRVRHDDGRARRCAAWPRSSARACAARAAARSPSPSAMARWARARRSISARPIRPAQCGALLRLELTPVGKHGDDALVRRACPEGLVSTEGKCQKKETAARFHCAPENVEQCSQQCEAGDAASCYALATRLTDTAQPDYARATAAFERRGRVRALRCVPDQRPRDRQGREARPRARGPRLQSGGRARVLQPRRRPGGRRRRRSGSREGAGALRTRFGQDGIAKDAARAADLYRRSCGLRRGAACSALAFMLETGDGIAADAGAALKMFDRACAALDDGGACHELGWRYSEGKVVAKDARRARELYVRGCDLGSTNACVNLAVILLVSDPAAAMPVNAKACELANATACNNLVLQYHNGSGVAADQAKARAAFARACDGKEYDG